mmetsp:Transcript_15952/g.22803  ORF Transcript_15952/g.22803 Transcript_15952/m.22803 type:complete len:909 (-) Transcript_15952:68-2794(-)
MLFMGTEKYPDENSYNEYLSQHGGSSNAYTDAENTNYYFDVAADHLAGALDRFAQFFINPLFTPSATERELQAVDSEHAKNLHNDHWRLYQLYKTVANREHPFSKFGSGCLATLKTTPDAKGIDVRQELLNFHHQFYSSNISYLVVLGKESLEELKQIVDTCFALIKNKNLPVPQFGTFSRPFSSAELMRCVKVVPVNDSMRVVEIFFPMREVNSLYLSKPTRYISHLFGHEGRGSILALLKAKGWANELSAGDNHSFSDWAAFTIWIEVTEEGLSNVDRIVEVVMAYIKMIRNEGPQKWIHDETATVASCQFQFLSKRPPIDYTSTLASSMHLYSAEHVLSGRYKIFNYDPTAIEECLSYLVPSNALVLIFDKNFEGTTDKEEIWYGTNYSLEPIEEDLMNQWLNTSVHSELIHSLLHLPTPNTLIPTDFTLLKDTGEPKDYPCLWLNTDTCRLWYKPDNVFQMPKCNLIILIKTIECQRTLESNVLCNLWVSVVEELCKEPFTYAASMASLHCNFQPSKYGIEIHLSGFNHKLHLLLKMVVAEIRTIQSNLTSEVFTRIQDKLFQQYQEFFFSQPYSHASYAADLALERSKFSIEKKIEALQLISVERFIEFSMSFLTDIQLEILVHGNVSRIEGAEIAATLIDGFKLKPNMAIQPLQKVIKLNSTQEYLLRLPEFNGADTNSALATLYQIGVIDIETNATLAFLHHLVKEPSFNELRTQEQLGYIVFTTIKTNGNNVKSLMFLIQSDVYSPVFLDARVEAFIDRFRAKLVGMPHEEFQANINAVVDLFLEKNKNLGEETSQYWSEISNQTYLFKRYQLIAEFVKTKMSLDILLGFFDSFICMGSPHRRKLSVQVFGSNHISNIGDPVSSDTEVTTIKYDSISSFREEMECYPCIPEMDLAAFLPN